ncbi:MAG TPA: NfeD family protein [Planctomycetota bacterium]|nr:NfeD family protein [Planctomycetota bacterium]
MELWLCIMLVGLGFVAIFVEFFVPAGGLVGFAGVAAMAVGIGFAYHDHGSIAGTLLLLLALVGTPASLVIGFKIFPHTFIGKRLILSQSQQPEQGYTASSSAKYEALLGKDGVTVSPLRPAGMVRIGSEKFSVVTEGEMIDTGKTVKVVAVEGNRIVVRELPPPSAPA